MDYGLFKMDIHHEKGLLIKKVLTHIPVDGSTFVYLKNSSSKMPNANNIKYMAAAFDGEPNDPQLYAHLVIMIPEKRFEEIEKIYKSKNERIGLLDLLEQ